MNIVKNTHNTISKEVKKKIKNKTIIVGVSGGPDSIFLLHCLMELQPKQIVIAHVNYNLRKKSFLEGIYLKESYESENCIVKKHTVRVEPKNNKQEWARNIRFSFFKSLCKDFKTDTVFVGTTNDDLVESFFMRELEKKQSPLFKVEGKIKHMNVIRPLFFIKKQNIITYLNRNKINFFIDETNEQDIFLRNQIRNRLNNKMTNELVTREVLCEQKLQFWINIVTKKNMNQWQLTNYDVESLLKMDSVLAKELVRKYLLSFSKKRNIGTRVEGLYNFLTKKNYHKQFRIEKNLFVKVLDKKLILVDKTNSLT